MPENFDNFARSILNAGKDILWNNDRPEVQHPPQFRKNAYPFVSGSPEFARAVEDVMNQYPQLRGRVGKIQSGPSAATASLLRDSGFRPDQFDKTNLMGVTDMFTKDVDINPRLTRDPNNRTLMMNTILHEFAHAMDNREDIASKFNDNIPSVLKHYRK